VARQPIVSADDRIVAFQLVQRASEDTEPRPRGERTLTLPAVLSDLSAEIGLLVGGLPLYCAADALLDTAGPVTPPAHRTVLEVPAELCADGDAVDRCHQLLQEGYSIALDRFEWHPGIESLLELADVVRIELDAGTREHVLDLALRCRPYGVRLLAAHCTTSADLAWAAEAGFDYFQGPAVQRPVEVGGSTLAPSALAQVQLATELLDDRLDFGRIEAILSHEPALVVKVLHQASLGAAGGLRRDVHSVREALVLLGTTRIRRWAALTVLGRQVSNPRADALATALVRARMCELLAQPRGLDRGFAFTAGLLSALDRLLGLPINEVESQVDVDDELAAAAFRRETAVGELVGLVADYQDAVGAAEGSAAHLVDVELVAAMAFCWAMTHVNAIAGAPAAA
jgi:EAL and modified HD-GYP domain-containing signal transduction protein